ncbi:MAG TPA: hypothetical protein VGG48_07615 [Rhizomicrobium sp.]|jgi:hypothetical protein
MKLDTSSVLAISTAQLMGAIAPQLPPGYPQAMASLTGFLLTFCAQDYENGADLRAAENADMRALFAELGLKLGDTALKAKLATAAASKDASLKISALDAANAELRTLLIALHEAVESDVAANARVWTVLKDMAARRVLKMPGS